MVKKVMDWIYISPHLDDVALSCGGLVWEQTQAGDHVSIWTICAGDPPPGPLSTFAQSLHTRWGISRDSIAERREEDITSCKHLGATYRHFDIPDCIYRQAEINPDYPEAPGDFLYPSEESLFGPVHSADENLIMALGKALGESMPSECEVVCPLTLGNHVDHKVATRATESTGRPLWYYADYPYALKNSHSSEDLLTTGWERKLFQISADGLSAWQKSVAAHRSQISTFWPDLSAMQTSLSSYLGQNSGIVLWKSL